jgi:hypothetical protein
VGPDCAFSVWFSLWGLGWAAQRICLAGGGRHARRAARTPCDKERERRAGEKELSLFISSRCNDEMTLQWVVEGGVGVVI